MTKINDTLVPYQILPEEARVAWQGAARAAVVVTELRALALAGERPAYHRFPKDASGRWTVVGVDFADDGAEVEVVATFSRAGDVTTMETMNVRRVSEGAK